MNSKKMFFIMCGVLALLGSVGIAGVVTGNKMLQKKSDQLLSLKLDNRTLEEQQVSLAQAKRDLSKYTDLERTAKVIVPQEKDQARTVREIINIANAADVKITSVTFPTSNLGQSQPKPAAPDSNNPTPAPSSPPLTQVEKVDNINGLYRLKITIQSDTGSPVPYSKLIDFLARLERNRRTAQVTSITVQPSPLNRNLVTFNLIINVYVKP